MEDIKVLQGKYKFACSDDSIEYKYIPETIKELSKDLAIIDGIIKTNKDEKAVLNLCKSMKRQLSASLKYLKDKLENIPNLNYLDESDEDWLDENKPQ